MSIRRRRAVRDGLPWAVGILVLVVGCGAVKHTADSGPPDCGSARMRAPPPLGPAVPTSAPGAVRAGSGPPLRLVADVPLPGPAARFDYQSVDTAAGRLYLAHMNAGRLYVAAESGVVSAFRVQGRSLVALGGIRLPHAHTVAVDPTTHLVFLPLENLNGRPVLRIMAPAER